MLFKSSIKVPSPIIEPQRALITFPICFNPPTSPPRVVGTTLSTLLALSQPLVSVVVLSSIAPDAVSVYWVPLSSILLSVVFIAIAPVLRYPTSLSLISPALAFLIPLRIDFPLLYVELVLVLPLVFANLPFRPLGILTVALDVLLNLPFLPFLVLVVEFLPEFWLTAFRFVAIILLFVLLISKVPFSIPVLNILLYWNAFLGTSYIPYPIEPIPLPAFLLLPVIQFHVLVRILLLLEALFVLDLILFTETLEVDILAVLLE